MKHFLISGVDFTGRTWFDGVMNDEGPSPEDIRRFGSDIAYCPKCGAEVADEAPQCPRCRAWISGETRSRPPVSDDFRRKMVIIIAIITLLAFSGLYALLRLF